MVGFILKSIRYLSSDTINRIGKGQVLFSYLAITTLKKLSLALRLFRSFSFFNCFLFGFLAESGGLFGGPSFKPFHAAGDVQEFFFTGIKRMALGTYFRVQFRQSCANDKFISAHAGNFGLRIVLWVDIDLHK